MAEKKKAPAAKKKIDHQYPKIDYKKCTVQKTCIEVCPVGVFEVENGKVIVKHPENCIECTACVINCPAQAIKLIGPDT